MSKLPLKPLVWERVIDSGGMAIEAQGAAAYYRAIVRDGKHIVYWMGNVEDSHGNKEFNSFDELKDWVDNDHYPHKMRPYVLTIAEIKKELTR